MKTRGSVYTMNNVGIAVTVILLGIVHDGEFAEQKVEISCERTCRDECKMTFGAELTISEDPKEEDVPDKDCYDKDRIQSMTDDEQNDCADAKSKADNPGVCHNILTSNDPDSLTYNQTLIEEKSIKCHMPNYNDDEKYYSGVSGTMKSEKEKCFRACHTTCTICWSKDNCVPACQIAKEHDLEGFSPVECARPFYFCNADLSVNTYSVTSKNKDEKGKEKIEKITYPFHVGTCSLDPALPVFFSIVILLLLMLFAYKLRNQIRSCLGRN